jgi:putative ATP-dependent endonuclease of the OLD family
VPKSIYRPSQVTITYVRVSFFRSLKNVEVSLSDLTVLVGANNVGKTTVLLDALQAAIGASRRALGKEDIYLSGGETDVPKDRKATIDVLMRPTDATGKVADNFPRGSFWINLWGEGISQSEPDFHDFVAIRTTLEWSSVHGDYRTSRQFLKDWKPFEQWLESEGKGTALPTQIEPIAMHYIDAKRDLEDDIRSRGSFWRRLTDDLNLPESEIKAFEESLGELNKTMIEKSEVLTHLRV